MINFNSNENVKEKKTSSNLNNNINNIFATYGSSSLLNQKNKSIDLNEASIADEKQFQTIIQTKPLMIPEPTRKPSFNSKNSNLDIFHKFYSVKEYVIKEEPNLKYRNSMEDYGKIVDMYMGDKSQGLFTLYDGHGGTDVVKYVKDRMPELISILLEKGESAEKALINSFLKIDNELKFSDSNNIGCTACVLLVTKESFKNVLYCANVGDTRASLFSDDGFMQISYDHKCSDSSELERIKQCKGIVFNGRVCGQLALTRALGDHSMKTHGVIATPYVNRVVIEDRHKFAVVASDGLWDVISEQDIFEVINEDSTLTANDLATILIKSSLEKGSKDNISLIVIKF